MEDDQPPSTRVSPVQFSNHSSMYEKHISCRRQRRWFEDDFNSHYKEYLSLYEAINDVNDKFRLMKSCQNIFREGSREYTKYSFALDRLAYFYAHLPDMIAIIKKFNYLHKKLTRIKRCMAEHDKAQCVRPQVSTKKTSQGC